MSSRGRTGGADDLRADLLADLAGDRESPGLAAIKAGTRRSASPLPRRTPALQVSLTPTRWAVVPRLTDRGLRVGPFSWTLTRQ